MSGRFSGAFAFCLVSTTSMTALTVPTAASAQEHVFSVPAQPASEGVAQFARQAGVQILIAGSDAKDRRTNEVRGPLSVSEALARLLANTGLVAKSAGPQTYTVVAHNDAAPVDQVSVDVDKDIVVTGSRLRRNAFTSLSPLQVIEGDAARAAGLSDVASMVQQSPVATGFQFDNSVTLPGDVASSGGSVGAATVSLRGLRPDRTLVLVNSRRLAPAGVEGAPTQPDLNLIPAALIERIELLTDGASSVYGSDAVAGVVNIILKDDLDGIEMTGFAEIPEGGGGQIFSVSAAAGFKSDRGRVTLGAEYYERRTLFRSQRPFSNCRKTVEQSIATGEVREACVDFGGAGGGGLNQFQDPTEVPDGAGLRELRFDFDRGSGFDRQPAGLDLCDSNNSILGPGTNTTGVPCTFITGDGKPDLLSAFGFDSRYNTNGYTDQQDLISPLRRLSFYATGDYELPFIDGTQAYFEASYSRREVDVSAGPSPVTISVPCANPFIQSVAVLRGSSSCANTAVATSGNPPSTPMRTLNWLPALSDLGRKGTEVEQIRGVMGFRGDFGVSSEDPERGDFAFAPANWRYDVFASYTRSNGRSVATQINDERLALALNTARIDTADEDRDGSTTDIVCGTALLGSSLESCVPLDPTAPEIYLDNRLPAAAAAYLAGDGINNTVIGQTIVSGFVSGDLFRIPAGTVPLVLGAEYRRDSIDSRNSFLSTSGSGLGGLGRPELNTIGARSLTEFFAETEIPVLKDKPFAHFLTFNASTRYTKESNFGSLWTYRLQGGYAPVPSLTFKATYGTTFRAPNLREQFLADQFNTIVPGNDPCLRLSGAPPITDPIRLSNCSAQGADPTLLGQGLGSLPQINVKRGGADDLKAETSRSITVGASFTQPWFESFTLKLSSTYFDIKVKNSVEEPGFADILRECLVVTPDLASPFCARIRRVNSGNPRTNFIDTIDASFFNVGELRSRGVDFNVSFAMPIQALGTSFRVGVDAIATRQLESSEDRLGAQDENLGEIEFSKWQAVASVTLAWEDFTVLWRARYTSGGIPDRCCTSEFPTASTTNPFIDGFSNPTTILGSGTIDPDGDGAPGTLAFDLPGFYPVGRVEPYWYHDLSISYQRNGWGLRAGVKNVLNTPPPAVNRNSGQLSRFGVVLGAGFDFVGRSYFLGLSHSF